MVLIEFPIGPGDVLERKLPLGAKGRAIVRDMDEKKINFLVRRNGHHQPATIEQKYQLQVAEEFDMRWSHEKQERTKEVIVMEPSAQRIVFETGATIILKLHIACFFLLKLYRELLSSSRFMNVCFSNGTLVTHGKIIRILEEGVIIKVFNKPKTNESNSNISSSSSSSSPSSPTISSSSGFSPNSFNSSSGVGQSPIVDLTKEMVLDDDETRGNFQGRSEKIIETNPVEKQSANTTQMSSSLEDTSVTIGSPVGNLSQLTDSEKMDDTSCEENHSQEIFISNEDLKFAEVVEDLTLIEPYVEAIMKMISIQPGDEVTIKGRSEYNKMKVRSITVPLSNPFQKKATVDGTQIAFRATNLVLHSKTKPSTENRPVYLKNGQKYKKVYWSKAREDLLGVYFDEDTKTLFAEIIDESNVLAQKRPRVLDCETEDNSKVQRIA